MILHLNYILKTQNLCLKNEYNCFNFKKKYVLTTFSNYENSTFIVYTINLKNIISRDDEYI